MVNPFDTASYIALFDAPVKLYVSGYDRDRRSSTDFDLSPRAVVAERTVLTFQMDPSSDADLFLDITINDTHVKRANPRGGVSRTVTEVIGANVLRWQNNTILFEMGGSGSVQVSDVVLWFYTELLSPGG